MTETYYDYLTQISWKGTVYRKFFLYPKIMRYCGAKTLDVGCGTGAFLKAFSGAQGVDINEHCVDHCKRAGLNAAYMSTDHLQFAEASFDTIVLDNVIEHIVNPEPLLVECRRVLKPEGNIIVGVPLKKGYARDPDHKKYYSADTLKSLMLGLGFDPQDFFEMPIKGLGNILSSACTYMVAKKSKFEK